MRFDVDCHYSHAAFRGRTRASAAIGASLPLERVLAFDEEMKNILSENFPDPLTVPHRVFALIVRAG